MSLLTQVKTRSDKHRKPSASEKVLAGTRKIEFYSPCFLARSPAIEKPMGTPSGRFNKLSCLYARLEFCKFYEILGDFVKCVSSLTRLTLQCVGYIRNRQKLYL